MFLFWIILAALYFFLAVISIYFQFNPHPVWNNVKMQYYYKLSNGKKKYIKEETIFEPIQNFLKWTSRVNAAGFILAAVAAIISLFT